MFENKIRPIAICVFHHRGRILVAEGVDTRKGRTFYRPLGGTIEFGERAEDTIRRELLEELNAQVQDLRYLGALENIFEYEGHRGHEIVLVFDGSFVNEELYEAESLVGHEFGAAFKVLWIQTTGRSDDDPPVYPDGLLDLLK